MRKKTALLSVSVLALVLPGAGALAMSERIYFGHYMGLNLQTASKPYASLGNSRRNGPAFAGALGVKLSDNFRLEAEWSGRAVSMTDSAGAPESRFRSQLALLNLYYDFGAPASWKIKPFIGAGAGFGISEHRPTGFSSGPDVDYGLSWQAGGGLQYAVNPRLSFTGAYRFLDAGDLDFGAGSADFSGHELRFGLTYKIPPRPIRSSETGEDVQRD